MCDKILFTDLLFYTRGARLCMCPLLKPDNQSKQKKSKRNVKVEAFNR